MFNNEDFGYHKVTVERPDRRKAQFSSERLNALRFDKSLNEVMAHCFAEYGEQVYQDGFLTGHSKQILEWCEKNEISLNTKAKEKLLSTDFWCAARTLFGTAHTLMQEIGEAEFNDFNLFKAQVEATLKAHKLKLSVTEKNALFNAVSWYDETAAKVVKKVVKLSADKLGELLDLYSCEEADLPDFGYYSTGKKGEFVTYESSSDLRDSESVPLTQSIYQYFIDEVQPHVAEAWLNMESVKIGYEVSFNKYFYRHKPLRSLETVAEEILALEQQADGLIAQILGLTTPQPQA